jgi:hypothetical protein
VGRIASGSGGCGEALTRPVPVKEGGRESVRRDEGNQTLTSPRHATAAALVREEKESLGEGVASRGVRSESGPSMSRKMNRRKGRGGERERLSGALVGGQRVGWVRAAVSGHKVSVLGQGRGRLAEAAHPDLLMQRRVRFLLHHVAWLSERRGGGGG